MKTFSSIDNCTIGSNVKTQSLFVDSNETKIDDLESSLENIVEKLTDIEENLLRLEDDIIKEGTQKLKVLL